MISILTNSYFSLKTQVEEKHKAFVEEVRSDVKHMGEDIQNIRIDQASIKGDIKLILDRQTRDNPIETSNNIPVSYNHPPTTIIPIDAIE